MMTILVLVSAVLATSALYVVAARGSATHTALATDNTAIGLRDASVDTLRGGSPQVYARAAAEWQMTTVDDLSSAEDFLDCLEVHGVAEKELIVLGNKCFAVRWR